MEGIKAIDKWKQQNPVRKVKSMEQINRIYELIVKEEIFREVSVEGILLEETESHFKKLGYNVFESTQYEITKTFISWRHAGTDAK